MVSMQYKITLPSEYNMQVIRKRVADNGHRTDGFQRLLFKCYLIQENGVDSFENQYAPLYVWKDSEGMNRFLFGGFYDNIIRSFGWQKVKIGVPLLVDLKEDFALSAYVLEEKQAVTPRLSLAGFEEGLLKGAESGGDVTGQVCIYNPDSWEYTRYLFYKGRPERAGGQSVYQILHISRGA